MAIVFDFWISAYFDLTFQAVGWTTLAACQSSGGPIMIIIFWIVFVLVCGSILVFAAGKGKGATKKKKKPISQGNLLRSIDNKTLEDR